MPPNVADLPEIDVVEFITGELAEFRVAAVVSVGGVPTGPTAAENFIAVPKVLVAVNAARKYLPTSPAPTARFLVVSPEISLQPKGREFAAAPGASQLYHLTVITGVGTPCQAPESS